MSFHRPDTAAINRELIDIRRRLAELRRWKNEADADATEIRDMATATIRYIEDVLLAAAPARMQDKIGALVIRARADFGLLESTDDDPPPKPGSPIAEIERHLGRAGRITKH